MAVWETAVAVSGRCWVSICCRLFFFPCAQESLSAYIPLCCLLGTSPDSYVPAYLVSMHPSQILHQSFQLTLCLLSEKLSPSINLYVSYTPITRAAAYTSRGPHYPSFICICIIHAPSHLLSITSLAASLMSCTLPLGVNTVRPAFPRSREQRHQRDLEGTERPLGGS